MVRLTERAIAGFDRAATRHHTTMTTMVQAIGEKLADDPDWLPEDIVARARELDRERRSRR